MADETNVEVEVEIDVEGGKDDFLRLCSRGRGRERSQSLRARDTRAVFTSLFYEGLSLGSVARESLESHAGGAWPERGQLTHVHVVRALYYMLYVTDVPFHRQRRNQREGRSRRASLLSCCVMNIEYFLFFFSFFLYRYLHLCPKSHGERRIGERCCAVSFRSIIIF